MSPFVNEGKDEDAEPKQGSSQWLERLSRDNDTLQKVEMMPVAFEGQFDPAVMARDVKILYKRLSMMDRWLLNPRSRFMQVRC